MAEPVSKEDIELHPWLNSWNKAEADLKIDLLRARIMELDNLVGTASVIIVVMLMFFVVIILMYLLDSGLSINPKDVVGLVKQVTGK